MTTSQHHEQNRRSWNQATPIHNSHKADQARFLAGDGSTVFDEELELTGDLTDKRLLHLQCNSGQDSLSLAKLGAQVTGVDISDAAIDFAQQLSTDSGIKAHFERDDLLAWFPRAAAQGRAFDVAFSTYGTIGWLEDLGAWARGVFSVLAPGGVLTLLEFHPLVWMFDGEMKLIDDYFRRGAIEEASGVNDYVGRSGEGLAPSGFVPGAADWQNPERAVAFQWTVADIVQACVDAGLVIEVLREYPYTNGCQLWAGQPVLPGNRYGQVSRELPLMLGIRARRPAAP